MSQVCITCGGKGRIYSVAFSAACPDCQPKTTSDTPDVLPRKFGERKDNPAMDVPDPHCKIEFNLDSMVLSKGQIDLKLRKSQEQISRWVIDTKEKAIRDGLIKLGWKPPEDAKETEGT